MLHDGQVGPGRQHLILLSVKDPLTGKKITDAMNSHGLRVCCATEVNETAKLLENTHPDLIILDAEPPDFAGFEFCRELRRSKRHRWVPVFFLIAAAYLDKKMEGYAVGADLFIEKPFHPEELAALTRNTLNRISAFQSHAIRDQMTGLYSRKYFTERLEEEIHQFHRKGKPFCVILIDLDRFKLVNDRDGHLTGDFVLSRFSRFLDENLRGADIVARYGGDEFILLMPETEAATAGLAIERLREGWLAESLVEPCRQKCLTVTFSAGVAQYGPDLPGSPDIISAADRALYAAKKAGRNRTVLYNQADKRPDRQLPLVLVVDDCSEIRQLLEKQLSKKGFRIVTAGDGREALKMAGDMQPPIAVIDPVLPGLNGIELIKMLRENPRNIGIRIIALTAEQFETAAVRAYRAGADDCISKPFSLADLEIKIRNQLNKASRGNA
ncbi:MAG TPA: diguanylate cyclase [Bacillota bacterium]|nr:diguanylate cyclase [Bacillota bacterium]